MADFDTLGGTVQWLRLRSQKVQSLGSMSFAIERESNIPALTTSKGGFIFSGKGIGLYPVAIVGDSLLKIREAMRNSSGIFYIDTKLASQGGFTIHAALRNMRDMKAIEVHDGGSMALKQGAGFIFAAMGTPLKGLWGTLSDLIGGANDLGQAKGVSGEVKQAFSERGVQTGKVGAIVHMYSMKSSDDTGRTQIKIKELAEFIS